MFNSYRFSLGFSVRLPNLPRLLFYVFLLSNLQISYHCENNFNQRRRILGQVFSHRMYVWWPIYIYKGRVILLNILYYEFIVVKSLYSDHCLHIYLRTLYYMKDHICTKIEGCSNTCHKVHYKSPLLVSTGKVWQSV